MTLAPASGAALAHYVSENRRPAVLAPFRFERFQRITTVMRARMREPAT